MKAAALLLIFGSCYLMENCCSDDEPHQQSLGDPTSDVTIQRRGARSMAPHQHIKYKKPKSPGAAFKKNIKDAFKNKWNARKKMDNEVVREFRFEKNTPEGRHINVVKPDARSLARNIRYQRAFNRFKERQAIADAVPAIAVVPTFAVGTTPAAKEGEDTEEAEEAEEDEEDYLACQEESQLSCDECYKYRSYNGSCNNLEHPEWGQSHVPFRRLLAVNYADGVYKIRNSVSGNPLPNARRVSVNVIQEINSTYRSFSMHFPVWGQFIDHDLTLTPSFTADDGSPISCCKAASENLTHSECLPIWIDDDDYFYSPFKQTCMQFVRSLASLPTYCDKKSTEKPVRQQINQLTSYIDGSMIYGSDKTTAMSLRSLNQGKLLAGAGNSQFPPHGSRGGCTDNDPVGNYCFKAGDVRVNEQPLLTTLHVIFYRFHNDLCDQLSEHFQDWEDEKLYQEARRIVIAVLQHITYNEFLSILFGPKDLTKYYLRPSPPGEYWQWYNSTEDATIYTEFAAAAYRFGHSTIAGLINVKQRNGAETHELLRDELLSPYDSKLVAGYSRGMTSQHCQLLDHALTKELTNHLFEVDLFGLDLASLNIQRGRDHGLPTYTQARQACWLDPIDSWEDLDAVMPPGVASLFNNVYESVYDIDLWAAGISEIASEGSVVGPTFACILGFQFWNTRFGDRFWYENKPDGRGTAFTPNQLGEIKKFHSSNLFCLYGGVEAMQLNPMRTDGKTYSCQDIHNIVELTNGKINWNVWENQREESCSLGSTDSADYSTKAQYYTN